MLLMFLQQTSCQPYVWNPSISSSIPTLSELTIKKTLRRNWKSRAGIFSMEDVFVDQNHNHQMEGLDNEEDVLEVCQPEEWVDKIREEWRILAEYLPETMFVRIYEDRMDLLRAVIVGPRETPYHNGLFFFDVCFPSDYPDSPPLVHYRSGGLGINSNLYKCGKVRLSLPKISCGQETMWVLGSSNMLQLLISIQDGILNANPLFNDMTYSVLSGSVYGKESSVLYNQNTFIKTLKTMVYTMKSLPKPRRDKIKRKKNQEKKESSKKCIQKFYPDVDHSQDDFKSQRHGFDNCRTLIICTAGMESSGTSE